MQCLHFITKLGRILQTKIMSTPVDPLSYEIAPSNMNALFNMLYSNFSDLVRSKLREELKEEHQLLSKEDEWQKLVKEIRADLQKTELAKMSKEQIIKRLRKTRDKIWEEKYA